MALTAKDADDWTYRGEGAVNLVLAYAGNSAEFVSFYFFFFKEKMLMPAELV